MVTELREGLNLVRHSRLLIGVLAGGAVVMLGLGAVNVLLIPFVIDELTISETWFGVIPARRNGGVSAKDTGRYSTHVKKSVRFSSSSFSPA